MVHLFTCIIGMSLLLDENDISAPLRIVTNTKDALQRLTLRNDMGRVLSHALKTCPNLRTLALEDQLQYAEEELYMPPSPLPAGPFPLKHLHIRCGYTTLNMIDLIQKSPHLESFHLFYDDEALEHQFDDLFRLIYYELSELRSLRVAQSACNLFQLYPYATKEFNTPRHMSQPGLCDLVISGNHLHAASEKIDLLIRKSKMTLERLDLERHAYVEEIYNTMVSTGMAALTVLNCGPMDDRQDVLLSSVIKACPMLQKVYIPPNTVSDSVLAALGQLQRLENISLSMEGDNITAPGVKRFMTSTATLQYFEVSISKHDSVTLQELVQCVLACPSMRILYISYDQWQKKSADMTSLKESMQRSGIRKVCFSGRNQALPLLKSWTHLKELQEIVIEEAPSFLEVVDNTMISDQDMKSFVKDRPGLSLIHVQSVKKRVCRVNLNGIPTIKETLVPGLKLFPM